MYSHMPDMPPQLCETGAAFLSGIRLEGKCGNNMYVRVSISIPLLLCREVHLVGVLEN